MGKPQFTLDPPPFSGTFAGRGQSIEYRASEYDSAQDETDPCQGAGSA